MTPKHFTLGLSVLGLLCGCAHYAPKPIAPSAALETLEARRLDDADLTRRIAHTFPTLMPDNQPPKCWDRATLFAAALFQNPDIAAARARLEEAAATMETASAVLNPTVGLGLEYQKAQAGTPSWLYSIAADYLVTELVQRGLRVDAAQTAVTAAHLDYADSIWQTHRAVRDGLKDLLLSQQSIKASGEAAAAAQSLAAAYKSRVDAGAAAQSDALTALTVASRAAQTEAAAVQAGARAQATLARAVGISIPALKAVPLCWEGLDQPQAPSADDVTQWREDALLNRTDLAQAINAYDRTEIELHQQIRAQYPNVTVGPGYTWDHGVGKGTFNLSFDLPIFNQNQGPIAAAEARREEAGHHLEAVQADILSQVDGAVEAMDGAMHALAAAEQNLSATNDLSARTARRFDLGDADRIELLTARMQAATADLDRLVLVDTTQQALSALEDALRVPLDDDELNLVQSAAIAAGGSQ